MSTVLPDLSVTAFSAYRFASAFAVGRTVSLEPSLIDRMQHRDIGSSVGGKDFHAQQYEHRQWVRARIDAGNMRQDEDNKKAA